MGKLTIDKPKTLVNFLGQPIIEYQLKVLRSMNIEPIFIVRGYKREVFSLQDVVYYDDLDGLNMVNAMFKAIQEFDDELVISYGDIIYSKEILSALLNSNNAINVAYDLDWFPQFSLRFSNPYEEIESFKIENNRIIEVGQRIKTHEDVQGQFIGLIKLSREGALLFRSHYLKRKSEFSDKPFKNKNFGMIFTTEFLQDLIDEGHVINGCAVRRGWIEFDHASDLYRYEGAFNSGKLGNIIDIAQIKNL